MIATHRLVIVAVLAVVAVFAVLGTSLASDLGARLDAAARDAEAQGFHGVVLVAKGGEEVLLQGYGTANAATGARYTPSTVVPIGSCVKDFTKVAILQLIEAGKLKLSDTLSRFFPEVPADKRDITVEQLMEHRAGFPLGVGPDQEPLTREELLLRVFARPLEFAPGTAERYSNAGYSLLAAIVEQISGQSFDAYVDGSILQPLDLRETGLLRPRFAPDRLAHAYRGTEDRGTMLDLPQKVESAGWALRGNGGYLSTVRDMLRFYRAVHGPVLLREKAHRDRVLGLEGANALAGSDMVSFFIFANFPREGVEIIVASNHADWKGEKLLPMLLPALGIDPPGGRRQAPAGVSGPAIELPDTGPWRTVAAYIAAFNSGDAAVMRRFLEEHADSGTDTPPIEKRLERFRTLHGDLGRLTVVKAKETADALEVTVRCEKGEVATFAFHVEPAAPFRLRGVQVMVG